MPRPDPSKRTPLWLQRLRAKDLLQVVRKMADFPIVVETYRECLVDDLDLPRPPGLPRRDRRRLDPGRRRDGRGPLAVRLGPDLQVHPDLPLPVGRAPPRPAKAGGDPVDLSLLDSLLEPSAIGRVEARLRGSGHPPRTVDEMAEASGPSATSTPASSSGPMAAFLELEDQAGL